MFTTNQIKNIEDVLEVSENIAVMKNTKDGRSMNIRPQLYSIYKLPEVSLLSMGNAHWTADFLNGLLELKD